MESGLGVRCTHEPLPQLSRACLQGGAVFTQGALGAAQSAAVNLEGAHSSAARRSQTALSLAHAPKSMPCRETEHADIAQFVEQAVTTGAFEKLILTPHIRGNNRPGALGYDHTIRRQAGRQAGGRAVVSRQLWSEHRCVSLPDAEPLSS